MNNNKTVLITGASSGIGCHLARIFAKNGYNLVITATSGDKLIKLRSQLQADNNIDIKAIPLDLSKDNAADILYEKVNKSKIAVDILVNNAGFGDHDAFLQSDYYKQAAMINLNICALTRLTFLFGRDMKQRGYGKILNISSCVAFAAGPYMSVYYASKAFVLSFSQAIAEELRGSGISVSVLCPGPVHTNFERAADMRGSIMFKLFPNTAKKTAQKGYKAVANSRVVTYSGGITHLFNLLSRITPRKLSCKAAGLINGNPYHHKKSKRRLYKSFV